MADREKAAPFDDYVIYRTRLADMLQLHEVLIHLEECKELPERPVEAIRAVHLVAAGFLAGFFDKRGDSLNVFRLWRKYFPSRANNVDALEKRLEPLIERLTDLRHKAFAHADVNVAAQNEARAGLDGKSVHRLFDEFYSAARAFLEDEANDADLSREVEKWGLKPAFPIADTGQEQ